MTKLIFLSGSARKGSYNTALAKAACEMAAKHSGVEAELIDLNSYNLPIFNEDIEKAGFPENALKLKAKFRDCDGFFIASPEYNSTFSPLLKNGIDWVSRRASADEPMLQGYKGKVAAISAASTGGLGGLRGLPPLRVMLSNIMVNVIPNQLAVGFAPKVFDDSGKIVDEKQASLLESVVNDFVNTAKKLKA